MSARYRVYLIASLSAALFLAIAPASMLTACSPQQEQQTAAVIATAAPAALAASPSTASKIALACPIVQAGLAAAASKVKGGAAQQVAGIQAIADASCTPEGQKQLQANDTKPVSATNSGDGAKWLLSLLPYAVDVAKVAMAVAPLL